MPNYRYNSSDYMRCGNYGQANRQMQSRSSDSSCQPSGSSCQTSGCRPADCDALNEMTVAMAYVPWQDWRNLYDIDQGLQRGTIFSELDKPFTGMRGGCSK